MFCKPNLWAVYCYVAHYGSEGMLFMFCCVLIKELALDSPLPWTTKNNLAFIAEQVSHHPPS